LRTIGKEKRGMSAGFEDITIVDLDVHKTTWSRVHSSMRTLYLKLSREPDQAWPRFFFEDRASRVEVKRHGLWIEEGYIVFDCLLEDVDSHHLPDIRQSVAYANAKSHELAEARRAESERLRADTRNEQLALDVLRNRIRGKNESSPERPPPAAEPTPEPIPELTFELPPEPKRELEIAPEPMPEPEFTSEIVPMPMPEPEPEPEPEERGEVSSADTPLSAPTADSLEAEFEERRKDWRTRFRVALERASKKQESERGND
jgi:hypothetical protein